jgi:hypothetical protein
MTLPGYHKVPILAKWEMLTRFSCLVLTGHTTNRRRQASKNGMAKYIFLFENIMLVSKTLNLI